MWTIIFVFLFLTQLRLCDFVTDNATDVHDEREKWIKSKNSRENKVIVHMS